MLMCNPLFVGSISEVATVGAVLEAWGRRAHHRIASRDERRRRNCQSISPCKCCTAIFEIHLVAVKVFAATDEAFCPLFAVRVDAAVESVTAGCVAVAVSATVAAFSSVTAEDFAAAAAVEILELVSPASCDL